MKQVSIRNIVIPSRSRSGNYPTGSTVIPGGGGSNATIDLSKYMKLALWLENFEAKTDTDGNQYIYAKKPLVSVGGFIAYCSDEAHVPSIFEGIPIDNDTIYWDESTGVRILKAKGSGGGSDFDATAMWAALSAATNEQINKSHLTDALSGYATESWVEGNGYALQTSLDAVSTKLNDFLEGSDTDTIINKWKELEAFLSGMAETDNLAEILSNKADSSYVNSELTKYVTLATEQEITGSKHFTNGLSIGASKHRLYEQDGIVYFDGDLAVTGGVTTYALGDRTPSSILDGLIIDETTLSKEGGKLSVIGGVGGASNWNELEGKPSWIGDTKPSYVWSEIGSKPTTLGGYGITDAYTKSDSDSRFVNVSGDTMTGTLTINSGGSYGLIINRDIDSLTYYQIGGIFKGSVGYEETVGINLYNTACKKSFGVRDNGGIYFDGNKVWHAGNDGSGSGMDADLLDGLHAGNASGQVAISNGTVCTNLNADMLDGYQITSLRRCYITNSHNVYDCLGTIQLPQYGNAARLYLVVGDGYNASESQSRVGMIILRTSNGNSNSSGKYYAGHVEAFRYGLYDIYVVQNSSTSFTLWTDKTNYTGNGYISVEATPGVNFISSSATSTTLPTDAVLLPKYQVAYTDSNVASATKLQTARTIWGQTFDGTQDVNGTINGAPAIELYYSTPFIDFHYNNSSDDYTSRIIEISSGLLRFTHNITVDGNVGIGTTSPAHKLDVNGDIHTNGWIRSTGNVGWYSQTYGGGWYMTDSTWIRAYNNKPIYTGGAIQTGGGFETFNSSILRYTPYTNKNVITWSYDNTYGDCITFNIPGNNSGSKYAKLNSARGLDLWGTFTANGNILATGGVTCYSSDQRAKTVIEQISLSLKQIANAPTIRFKWNDWKIKDDGKTHIGGIAQYMQAILPETVLEADGMLNLDYATTGYVFAVQTARCLLKTDTEVEKLKKRVKKLEKQLKQLGYEEVNIMDD